MSFQSSLGVMVAAGWLIGSPLSLMAQEVIDAGSGEPGLQKAGVTKFEGITVVGSHQQIRGGIASLAEQMHSELANLTGEKGRKAKLPIIIQLYGAEGDQEQKRNVVSRIDQVEGRYQLKIYIHLAKGVDHDLLRYHLMKILLCERGLSDGQKVLDGERVVVKPWLIVGMLEALGIKNGQGNRKIYQVNMPYFDIVPLQKVFDATESEWRVLDGRRPVAFRAISGAMVNALLRQPDGRHSMGAYLGDVATFKGEEENLMRKHFPSMNKSRNSLGKWVDLEMAELGTAVVSQVHSLLETEKRLESVLRLRYRDAEQSAVSVGVDGYREILKLDPADRVEAVAGARAELERLSYRCFPTYRPLIAEYDLILREVASGKDEGVQGRITKMVDVRLRYKKAGVRVRNYLDWYYITQSNEVSGNFKQYRELSEALKRESMKPKNDDFTQTYLDDIQKMYGR